MWKNMQTYLLLFLFNGLILSCSVKKVDTQEKNMFSENIDHVERLITQAKALIIHHQIDSAEQQLHLAHSFLESKGIENDSLFIQIDLLKGKILHAKKEYEQAEQIFDQNLNRLTAIAPPYYSLLGQNYKSLADLEVTKGEEGYFEKAQKYYERAKDHLEKQDGNALYLAELYLNCG